METHGYASRPGAVKQDPSLPPAPGGRPRRGRWRRRAGYLGGTLAAGLALWLLRAPLLTAVAGFLSVSDPLRPADAIFIFGGDAGVRPFAAASLYRRGVAPRVLLPRMETGTAAELGLEPTQTELFQRVLRRQGVPDSAVTVLEMPGGSGSTRQDARLLAAWLRQHPQARVVAVTTRFHSRRARLALRRTLGAESARVLMRGVPSRGFSEHNWWRSEGGLVTYFEEYIKLARDWLGRGDDPGPPAEDSTAGGEAAAP